MSLPNFSIQPCWGILFEKPSCILEPIHFKFAFQLTCTHYTYNDLTLTIVCGHHRPVHRINNVLLLGSLSTLVTWQSVLGYLWSSVSSGTPWCLRCLDSSKTKLLPMMTHLLCLCYFLLPACAFLCGVAALIIDILLLLVWPCVNYCYTLAANMTSERALAYSKV